MISISPRVISATVGRSALIVALAAIVFVFDILMPLGVAGGFPYVAVVLLALNLRDQRAVVIVAIACSVLTLFGLWFSPALKGAEYWIVMTNRGLAMFAILVTAILSLRLLHDIAEKQWDVAAIKKYMDLYENDPDMHISVETGTGKILDCNETLVSMTGFTKGEIIGGRISDLYFTDMEEVEKERPAFLETGEVRNAEYQFKCKDGSAIDVSLNSTAVRDELGNIHHCRSVWRDITEVKRTAEKLRQFDQRLRLAVDTTRMGFWEWDLRTDFSVLSDEYFPLYGLSKSKQIQSVDEWESRLHPDDRERALTNVRRSCETGVYEDEFRVVWPNGTVRWLMGTGKVIHNDAGQATHMIGVNADITEHKLVAEQQRRLATVLRDSNDAVTMQDFDGRITAWNRGAERMYGYSEAEAMSMNMSDLVPEDRRHEALELTERIRRGEEMESLEIQRLTKDGRTLEVWLTVNKVVDDTGRVVGLTTTERDLRRIDTIGRTAGTIAHELRNPLASIHNAQFYLKRKLPRDQPQWAEYLEIIGQEVATADRIIKNLLDLTQAKKPLKTSIDLSESVSEARSFAKVPDHIRLRCIFETEPYCAHADGSQWLQVLSNLFTNATQAMNGTGQIDVEARREGADDVIVIRDNGPGIVPEERDRVFQPLFTTRARGIGLGLAICRQIVEGHGGNIRLMDADGEGTTFVVRLPCATTRAKGD